MSDDPESHVPLTWVDWEETPIAFVNQFVCQFQTGEFVLSIGQAFPPPILGTPEERREQVENIDFLPITTLTRVGFTRDRMVQLIAALEANLAAHDRLVRENNPLGGQE